jgi:hypothetical protein
MHDCGSGMGLHYTRFYPDNIKGIVTVEALMAPLLPVKNWKDYPKHKANFSKMVRSVPPRDCRRLNILREYDNEKTNLYS